MDPVRKSALALRGGQKELRWDVQGIEKGGKLGDSEFELSSMVREITRDILLLNIFASDFLACESKLTVKHYGI